MSRRTISGAAIVAGVAGDPIAHSLSPRLHNAWIETLGLDAAYVPFRPTPGHFEAFVEGLKGGAIRGLNVTLPFKAAAAGLADRTSDAAQAAGAANLLLFEPDGRIAADNTDGAGLFYAFARQAPGLDPAAGPIAIFGAGGAARGAVAALKAAGASDIRILNRTASKAEALANDVGAAAFGLDRQCDALDGVKVVINATAAQLSGEMINVDFSTAANGAVAMDMLYRPLKTAFLSKAEAAGLGIVDGLDMLIGQAIPSFQALFGVAPPPIDARALLLTELGA